MDIKGSKQLPLCGLYARSLELMHSLVLGDALTWCCLSWAKGVKQLKMLQVVAADILQSTMVALRGTALIKLRANLQGKLKVDCSCNHKRRFAGFKAPNRKPEGIILSCIQDALKQRLKFESMPVKYAQSKRRQLDSVSWFGKLFYLFLSRVLCVLFFHFSPG